MYSPLDPNCPDNPFTQQTGPFGYVDENYKWVEIVETVGDEGPVEHGPPEPIYRIRYVDGTEADVPASSIMPVWEDPMTTESGVGDEIAADLENKHRAVCRRCQEYGAANIEVGDSP